MVRHSPQHSSRRARRIVLGLGVLCAFGVTSSGIAQTPKEHFTVRPHEMATGTQTAQAGEFTLDSLPRYLVYVPKLCVGTRRCPLVVFLHGAGYGAEEVMTWQHPVADKYGMIILAPTSPTLNWDEPEAPLNRANISAAMQQVLRKFAIDPDKIALLGRCAGGPSATNWGVQNADIFSRILIVSGTGIPYSVNRVAEMDPRNKTTEFLVEAGLEETHDEFMVVRQLRHDGHPVKHIVTMRSHAHQTEDYDFIGRWLQESWAIPTPAARPAPRVVANPMPLLTVDAVNKMTAFWTSFQKEPDSIRTTARQAHQREVALPFGKEQPSVVLVDIAALAAKYPSVAADLKAAGLTAQQHEAYRIALISARIAKFNEDPDPMAALAGLDPIPKQDPAYPIDPASVLGKNLAFTRAHPEEFKALVATDMWHTP